MNAEGAGLVGGGGHDAALFRISAHYHWLASQPRVVALLHRCLEGIHVDMDDLAVILWRRGEGHAPAVTGSSTTSAAMPVHAAEPDEITRGVPGAQ